MRFSIIIPAYNVERYVECCIRSICEQNFEKWEYEVIVIDDKSTDNTPAIIEALAQTYNNLHIIRHNVNKCQGGGGETRV